MPSVLLVRTGSLYQLRITFLDRMQLSGTAKDVPARRNGLLGIKTQLDPNHAGPMEEKTKESEEHFYNYYLFTISEEKHVAQQKVYEDVIQGKMREVWGATIIQATYKSRHSADLARD